MRIEVAVALFRTAPLHRYNDYLLCFFVGFAESTTGLAVGVGMVTGWGAAIGLTAGASPAVVMPAVLHEPPSARMSCTVVI